MPQCTAEAADYYSYRRDGTTGRFAGLVWREQ
jgi:copper oxidase (laccase) domain-containing protein